MVIEMTKQEYTFFTVTCESYIEGQSFEDYKDYIHKWLMLSDWHYTSEQAAELIEERISFIEESYARKESVSDAAVDVGYCCG